MSQSTDGRFERIVDFEGAYDKREKNCGVGGVSIRFVLKGEKGAVQFLLFTNWQLQAVAEWHATLDTGRKDFDYRGRPRSWPMAADVGYHAKVPQREGQEPQSAKCEYTGGGCYYDGSGCLADDWLPDFIAGGTKWLWPKLEEMYASWLETPTETTAVTP